MKRFLLLLLCAVLLLSCAACAASIPQDEQGKLPVSAPSAEESAGGTVPSEDAGQSDASEATPEISADGDASAEGGEEPSAEISDAASADDPAPVPEESGVDEPTSEPTSEPEESGVDESSGEPSDEPEETPPQPLHVPTPMEQEIFDLLNEERVKNGCKELTYYYEIYPCALVRAQEAMVQWSHTRPNGEKSSTVYADCGIPLYGVRVSENLGKKFHSAEQIMEAFMNSEGHRANILNTLWDSVCIAVAEDENGTLYVSQLFVGKTK